MNIFILSRANYSNGKEAKTGVKLQLQQYEMQTVITQNISNVANRAEKV